ncbi:hypothetical protein N8703_04310 [Verrucomicrobia bacterium]|nr:hypothetical protein [Verrucomicrobiota bacterium]
MASVCSIGVGFVGHQMGWNSPIVWILPMWVFCLIPVFVFVGIHNWKKSKCKPIYDRWVMQHGLDPENWPEA